MRDLAADLVSIADASRRPDGSDIPLGQQVRQAAAAITSLSAEVERLRGERDEAIKASKLVDFNMKARAEAAEERVKVLEKSLRRIANHPQNHDERGKNYSVWYAFDRVQAIARAALSHTKESKDSKMKDNIND